MDELQDEMRSADQGKHRKERIMGIRTLWQKLRYYPEVISVILFFGLMMLQPIQEQYLNKVYSEKHGLKYESNTKKGSSCPTNTTNSLLHEVQVDVSIFLSRIAFCISLPPILGVLFFGPLSDRYGRKPFLVLNIVGCLLYTLTLVIIEGFGVNISFLYVGGFMSGICGYLPGLIMIISAYLSDVCSEETLPLRIAIIDLITFTSLAISNMLSGLILKSFGFLGSFIFISALVALALFVAIFYLRESLVPEKRTANTSHWIKGPKKIYVMLVRPRSQKWRMRLMIPTDVCSALFSQSVLGPLLLLRLLNTPFCWNPTQIGFIRGTFFLVAGFGAVFAVKLIPMCFRKPVVMMLSYVSSCGYLLLLGSFETKTMYYVATVIGMFSFASTAMTKSILGSYVDLHERGSLFAFLASLQSLLTVIATYIYQALYRLADKRGQPGAIFIVMSFMTIIPFFLAVVYLLKNIRYDRRHRKLSEDGTNTDKTDPLVT